MNNHETELKISGCGCCPFMTKYRSYWECSFSRGYRVQRLDNYMPESNPRCPLLDGPIIIEAVKKERTKNEQ